MLKIIKGVIKGAKAILYLGSVVLPLYDIFVGTKRGLQKKAEDAKNGNSAFQNKYELLEGLSVETDKRFKSADLLRLMMRKK